MSDLQSTTSQIKNSILVSSENTSKELEANEYFKTLKSSNQTLTKDSLVVHMDSIVHEIAKAKKLGQSKLVKALEFSWKCSLGEVQLVGSPFNNYIDSSVIKKYIANVKPRNSVKLIELDRLS